MRLAVDAYLARSYDPARFLCWDLVREAWLDMSGQDIGDRTPHPASALAISRRVASSLGDFEAIPEPESPCLVLMRQSRAVPHVGLFWRGRVLHIDQRGARFERLADATRGFERIGFYRCKASS